MGQFIGHLMGHFELVAFFITIVVILGGYLMTKAQDEWMHAVQHFHIDELLALSIHLKDLRILNDFLSLPLQVKLNKIKYLRDQKLVDQLFVIKPKLSKKDRKTVDRFYDFLSYYNLTTMTGKAKDSRPPSSPTVT
jgi:uncharacterized membrane protein required for colicin V production